MKTKNQVRKDATIPQPQSNAIPPCRLNLHLAAEAKAQLAHYANQIAVPDGTLARLAILSVLHSLDDSDVLQGFAEMARGEILMKCAEVPDRIGLNAN